MRKGWKAPRFPDTFIEILPDQVSWICLIHMESKQDFKNFLKTFIFTEKKEFDTKYFDGQFMGITLAENSLKP